MQSRPPIHPPRRRLIRSAATGTAVASLLVSGLAFAPIAQAAERQSPAEAAAIWLEGELVDGALINVAFASPDYGLSIDAGLALREVPGHRPALRSIRRSVADNLDAYITGEAFGDVGSTYAGAVAKAAVFADRTGADPRGFGGVNLISRLKATIATDAPVKGRIQDISGFGDYANVIGQAYAAEVLLNRSPNAQKTDRAFGFLLRQQCDDGYFRLNFNPDKTAADQTCDGGTADESAADTDTTALVILSLLKSGTTKPRAVRAVADAVSWLADQQARSGSFGGGTSTEGANTNSTGLASAALGAAGAERRAARAAAWIRRLQAGSVGPCQKRLGSDRGTVAYDRPAYGAAVAGGITDLTSDQWTRATAQALLGLPWAKVNRGGPTLDGPSRPVRAGGYVRLRLGNLEAGERVCVFAKGFGSETKKPVLSRRGGSIVLRLAVPDVAGDQVYRSMALGGNARVLVKVR